MVHKTVFIGSTLLFLLLVMSGCGENDDIQLDACTYDETPLSWDAPVPDSVVHHADFDNVGQWADHFAGTYAVAANAQDGEMTIARGEGAPLKRTHAEEQAWCSDELIVPIHVTLVQNDTEWSHALPYDLAHADAGGSHAFRDLEDTEALTAYAPRPALESNQHIHAVFAALTLVPFKDITLTFHSGIETTYSNGDLSEFHKPWFEFSAPVVDE